MKKGMIILLVILILLVLGMGGYLVYDKLLIKDESKEENTLNKKDSNESISKEIDINSDLVKSLTEIVEEYTIAGDLQNVIPYDETKEVILNDDISDDMKGAIALNLSKLDSKYYDKTDKTVENAYRITDEGVSIIKNNYIRLFGYDGFKEATACPNVRFINNNYYEITGCGYGPYINTSAISPISAEKDGDDIVLEAKVVFALWEGSPEDEDYTDLVLSTNRYDINKKNTINKLSVSTYQDIVNLKSNDFEKFYQAIKKYASNNQSLLDTYVYRFKKNNDSYYLYSVKKA